MRQFLHTVLALAAALLLAAPAGADQYSEANTNRPGQDMRSFAIPHQSGFATEESICRSACEGESECRSWTVVKPGIQGTDAVCWLKSQIPGKVSDSCCTSGVMSRPVEGLVNRPGKDYSNFRTDTLQLCQSACTNDGKCAAWTYVPDTPPGYGLSPGQCWLKSSVPNAVSDLCCISGVADRFLQPH